jgi:hypothetical protein
VILKASKVTSNTSRRLSNKMKTMQGTFTKPSTSNGSTFTAEEDGIGGKCTLHAKYL